MCDYVCSCLWTQSLLLTYSERMTSFLPSWQKATKTQCIRRELGLAILHASHDYLPFSLSVRQFFYLRGVLSWSYLDQGRSIGWLHLLFSKHCIACSCQTKKRGGYCMCHPPPNVFFRDGRWNILLLHITRGYCDLPVLLFGDLSFYLLKLGC